MRQDGPYNDGNGDDRAERQLRVTKSDSGAPGSRAELAEPRTRTEYYEALREAARDDGDVRDNGAERSGWDGVPEDDRPPRDGFRLSAERAAHILDGEPDGGGGHRSGTGKPGKTEFPASWDDGKVLAAILDVVRRPDSTPGHQEWNGRWVARGTRDDVGIVAVIERDGRIWTAWPLPGGPEVVKNPERT